MSNSSLVTYTNLSPNHYNGRYEGYNQTPAKIYIMTPHCMAYDGSVESCGNVFANPSRNASSNYGIGSDGRIGMYVEEKNGSWCTSNMNNDMHAITVEIACEPVHPYKMTDKAIEAYINLTVDCMKRNGLKKLTYCGSLEATQKYRRANDEALLTIHRWYAAKACPGDYFVSKIPYVVSEVNKRLGGTTSTPTTVKVAVATKKDFSVTKGMTYITKKAIKLRVDAGIDKKAIEKIPKDTEIKWYGYYNLSKAKKKWYYVEVNGKKGYLYANALKKVN